MLMSTNQDTYNYAGLPHTLNSTLFRVQLTFNLCTLIGVNYRMNSYPMANRMESPRDTIIHRMDPIIETVRTFFPETWLWDMVEVG